MKIEEPKWPIAVVARRTGLSTHVIRVWERRYGAVQPMRGPRNRRLYSEADIDRLCLIRRVTEEGHSVGQVAQLPKEELERLVESSLERTYAPKVSGIVKALGVATQPAEVVRACLGAVDRLDAQALWDELMAAHIALSLPLLIEEVVVPFMTALGEQWRSGQTHMANEHLASEVVRSFLVTL